MKTLYVSDLDGTLMQPDARISPLSARLLNEAIAAGADFTIATARTPATVADILKPVDMQLPAIVMTGAALWNPADNSYADMRLFDREAVEELVEIYRSTNTSSFLFTLDGRMIDIYHIGGALNELQCEFIREREHSPYKRFHISESGVAEPLPDKLSDVVLLYTMIPDAKAASTYALTSKLPGVRAQYYHDIFGPEIGILEAFAQNATKAKAVRALAEKIGAERIVAFGDNINDLPMFEIADLSVAVENALPVVKERADIIIGPNTDDSVARFIHQNTIP